MIKATDATAPPTAGIIFGSFDATPIVTTPVKAVVSPATAQPRTPTASPSAWGSASKTPTAVLSPAGLPASMLPKSPAPAPAVPASASRHLLGDVKREHFSLSTRLVPLAARGLVNAGNLCFMNAVLQALVASRPFYSLCRYLQSFDVPPRCGLLDAFSRFITEFPEGNANVDNRAVYAEYLTRLVDERFAKSGSRETQLRRQEDAHELLTFLLDTLHEELLSLRSGKSAKKQKQAKEDEWSEVGRKQKVATVLESSHPESAISWIFEARVKSTVRRDGGKASARVEPMTSLPLDVVWGSVEHALQAFFTPETLQGVTDGSSLVQARRHMHLHTPPPVLIFHVKRFEFETGMGTQKITDMFHFPMSFVFDQELLAQSLPVGQRSYSLLAVISHHGGESGRGHYTADVRQASGRWLCFDDAYVHVVSPDEVMRRQAYLLFYILSGSP